MTTTTLELLAGIIDGLEPVGGKTQGVPLRAADWNTMVTAVVDLARLVESRERNLESQLERRFATVEHSHTGEVGMSWFEPRTRALLEEGTSGSAEQRAALGQLRQDVDRLRQDMAQLRQDVEGLRADFDGLRDDDQARGGELSRLALRVESLADVEDHVTVLTGEFSAINENLAAALDFRRQLVDVDGSAIDVRGLVSRVGDLETLRRNLTTANGELVRIRELESEIRRLGTVAVDRNDIDEVILDRLRAGEILNEAGLVESVAERVRTDLGPRIDGLDERTATLGADHAELSSRVDAQSSQLSGFDGRVDAAEDALAGLSGVAPQLAGLTTRVSGLETRTLANQSAVESLPNVLLRLSELEREIEPLPGLVEGFAGLGEQVERLELAGGRIDELFGHLDGLGGRLTAAESGLSDLVAVRPQIAGNSEAVAALGQRLVASEAQLDNLAGLPQQITDLDARTQDLPAWRASTESRLEDLGQLRIDADRLARLEELNAEHGSSLRELSRSFGGFEQQLPTLLELPSRLEAFGERLSKLDRPGGPGPIIPIPGGPFRPIG